MFPLASQGETKEEKNPFDVGFWIEAKEETSQEMGEKQFPFLEEERGWKCASNANTALPLRV